MGKPLPFLVTIAGKKVGERRRGNEWKQRGIEGRLREWSRNDGKVRGGRW